MRCIIGKGEPSALGDSPKAGSIPSQKPIVRLVKEVVGDVDTILGGRNSGWQRTACDTLESRLRTSETVSVLSKCRDETESEDEPECYSYLTEERSGDES